MCQAKTCLAAAAAIAAVLLSGSAGAQAPASGAPSFETSVSAALVPDGPLSSIAGQKADAAGLTAGFQADAFRGGGPGRGGDRPGPRPGPGPGRVDPRRGGDWGRWPNHPGWGGYYNRWVWVGLAPHWWGWALWTGVAERGACVNWYAGELNSCSGSCAAENSACASACYGDADCAAQCGANANSCTSTCQSDYSLKLGSCPL